MAFVVTFKILRINLMNTYSKKTCIIIGMTKEHSFSDVCHEDYVQLFFDHDCLC